MSHVWEIVKLQQNKQLRGNALLLKCISNYADVYLNEDNSFEIDKVIEERNIISMYMHRINIIRKIEVVNNDEFQLPLAEHLVLNLDENIKKMFAVIREIHTHFELDNGELLQFLLSHGCRHQRYDAYGELFDLFIEATEKAEAKINIPREEEE